MIRTSAWFLLYPMAFFGVFAFFQNETCYRIFSPPTYARTESGIVGACEPYAPWTDENHRHWDVVFYEVVKDEGYDAHGQLHPYKQAFFPLFSYVWRWVNVPVRYAGLLSWGMFAVGLLFLALSMSGKPYVVAAVGLLPASFVFVIPYSEGAMFVSLAVGMGAATKRWHALSWGALFAAGMSRPAIIFFVAALVLVEWMRFSRDSWRNLALFALPVVLGYTTTLGIMAVESGSWIGPFVAQKYWQTGQFSWTVRDWSHEGFFMTLPAIFLVWLPCAGWCLTRLFHKNVPHSSRIEYWAWVSAFVVLFTAYAWYKNEGGLNGLSRYLTATPFFAVIALVVSQNRNRVSLPLRRIYVLVGFGLCLIFSAFSGYAMPWNFAVLGLILTCVSIALIVLPAPRSLIFWAFYVLLAVFWHAHVVNMLLRDAWIVT